MEEKVVLNRRKHIRFNPGLLDVAQVSQPFDSEELCRESDFEGKNVGLILEESYSGCSLVLKEGAVLKRPEIENEDEEEIHFPKGSFYWIKVGRLAPLVGIVRWNRELETGLVKVGFEFME